LQLEYIICVFFATTLLYDIFTHNLVHFA